MRYSKSIIVATVVASFLIGCGGGSESKKPEKPTENSQEKPAEKPAEKPQQKPVEKPKTRTKIIKTGQTKSYNWRGDVIADGSIKDDGYYQAGITRSYTRRDVGIVKDNVTGLEWQDTYEGNTLYSQDNAKRYCTNLELDGKGWRLPSMYDLWYILDNSKAKGVDGARHVLDPIFQNVTRTYYMSTYGRFWFKFGINLSDANFWKIDAGRVKCVRNNKIYKGNCVRDNNNDIVLCDDLGLTIQDVEYNKKPRIKWEEAIKYCENLEHGDYTDWRLPNINELRAFYHDKSFLHVERRSLHDNHGYWSSTTSPAYKTNAFYFPESAMSPYMNKANDTLLDKSGTARVRCVR